MHLEQVLEIVHDIKNLMSGIEKEEENVFDPEEDCSALEKGIEREGKRLRMIEEGEEWMQLKEFKTELPSLEEELNALESDVSKLFFPVNKALNLLGATHPITKRNGPIKNLGTEVAPSPSYSFEGE